jgi:hypothetical protein
MFPVLTLQPLLFRIFGRLCIEVAVFTSEDRYTGLGATPGGRSSPSQAQLRTPGDTAPKNARSS